MKKIKKSGIILITTLIFMTLTFMLAVMICKNGKESLFAGIRYAENEQAYLATVSGIEYIKGQLYSNRSWEVDAPTKSSNKKNGILIEKKGNTLTGYILTDASGTVSKDNYDSKFEIFSKNNIKNREYKTINNLSKLNTISPVTANSPNETANPNGSKRKIPAKTFYAYVKGTCGKTVRYAEAMFISNGPIALEGGNIINGAVDIKSKTNEIYTKENPFITIKNVSKQKNGKITASDQLNFEAKDNPKNVNLTLNNNYNVSIASNGIKVGNFEKEGVRKNSNIDQTNNEIEKLTYHPNNKKNTEVQNLSKESNQTTTNTLRSGTYAYVNDLKNPSKSYWVYNQETDYDKLKTLKFKKYNKLSKDNINNIAFNGRTVNVTGNISSDGGLNFIVIDKTKKYGLTQYTISKTNTIDFSISQNGKITTNNSGNIVIKGEVTGTGKIYSAGNLKMNAGSILETQAQSGVAIYAEKDIEILKVQNLTENPSNANLERDIIEKALYAAREEGITLVSSTNETEYTEDENGNIEPAVVLESEKESTNTTSEVAKTEIVINGHTYNVSGIINNYRTEEDNNKDIVTISCTYNSDNYKLELNDDYISIYINGNKCSEDIQLDDIKSGFKYHDTTLPSNSSKPIEIIDYNAGDSGYMQDFLLKIDGHKVGIIDKIGSDYTKTNYTYSDPHKTTNGKFLFSIKDYNNNVGQEENHTCECKNFEFSESTNSSTSAETTTITSDNNTTTKEEVTIQKYVENYYKNHIGDTIIKGSMYSKNGNISINGQGKNFNVTGALITANGDLSIKNASHVNMIYDPDYVPFFQEQGILTTTIFESTF